MLDIYVLYQLARDPLRVIAKSWMCRGLTIATNGRHQCRDVAVKTCSDCG
ncbi:hypothetical protein [Rhodopseudomonas palustris]|uniref:Uncharacterized protein n=1 Tax=Rhodopseudomonas palustris (strain BisB18) TaxID=316056 RepID=Q21B82_RHOPB